MIDAAQEVLDTEDDVRPCDLGHAASIVRRTVELHRRVPGGERVHAALAVAPDDLDHGRRVAFADAVYRQRAFQAIGPATQRARPSRVALRPVRYEVVSQCRLGARGAPVPQELARGS